MRGCGRDQAGERWCLACFRNEMSEQVTVEHIRPLRRADQIKLIWIAAQGIRDGIVKITAPIK
jgi:hypothetical protein